MKYLDLDGLGTFWNGANTRMNDLVSTKLDTLISGTNIKTINNLSLLGKGNLIIEGGGTGSQYYIRLVNNLENRVFAASIGSPCFIDFTFVSQYSETEGGTFEDTRERAYIKIYVKTKGSEYNLVDEFYKDSGTSIKIDVAPYLIAGENDVKIEATGEDTNQTAPSLTYGITLTSLSLTAPNFQWWNNFTTDITIPLLIGGNINKVLSATITGEDYYLSYDESIGTHTYVDTAYNYIIPHPQKSGVFTLVLKVSNVTGTISTKELVFDIICTVSGDTGKYIAINNLATTAKNWSDNVLFDYVCYDGNNAFTTVVFDTRKDDEIITSNSNTGVSTLQKYTFNLPLEIETIDNSNFTIDVDVRDAIKTYHTFKFNVDNSLGYAASAGAALYINPKTRSNTQDNKEFVINEMDGSTIDATWHNVGWGYDGWYADKYGNKSLHLVAGSSVDINYKAFAQEASRIGKTIEFDFMVSNASSYDQTVINMFENGVGVKIYPDLVSIYTQSLKDTDLQSINFKDDDRIRMTIVIMPNAYGHSGFNLCIVYINGVKNREFTYESNDYFYNESTLKIGSPDADIDIYGIRIYDSALSPAAVLVNLINQETTVERREAIKAKNDLLDSYGVDIDYGKIKTKYNVFIFEGEVPSLKNPNEFKGNLNVEWVDHPEWNSTVYNVSCDGQGTSSKRYLHWNLRWKLKSNTRVSYSNDSETTGSWRFVPNLPNITKLTAKLNWASSMQSHKIGSVNSIDDLAKEMNITNEANARISIYQYPFVGFLKTYNEDGEAVYTFLGLYTVGPDKGDDNTFGYDDSKFPTLLSLEGSDNAPLPALFRVPWNSNLTRFAYNDSEEAYQYNGVNCWDFNFGDTRHIKKWVTAYNFVYECSPRLVAFEGTLEDINAVVDDYKDTPVEYWLPNGDVIYYEASTKKYEYSDTGTGTINLIDQLVGKSYMLTADMLENKTAEEKTQLFINARVEKFRQEMENYWDLQDAIFQRNWVEFNAATDNRAKNTYPYIFGEYRDGCRWRWRSDDTDTIWPINNQGQSKKGYYVEVGDKYDNGQPVWNGETSNFWNLLDMAFPSEILNGMRTMITAMENLSDHNAGESSEKIFEFFKKYYFDVAQEHFSETLYNMTAKKLYEMGKLAYIDGSYTNDTDPITQSLGDHYSAERRWLIKRIPYMLSKYSHGDFSADGTDSITVRAAGNIITYELTPAVWMYPTIINGTSVVRGERTQPNETCVVEVDLGGSADQQNTIQGASYLRDIGKWHNKNVTGPMIVKGKMLEELHIGHPTEDVTISITSLTLANTPSLKKLMLSNVSTLGGTLDLTQCPRLEECYLDGTSVVQTLFYSGGNLQKVVFGSNNAYINFKNVPLLARDGVNINACKENITDFLTENCTSLNPLQLLYDIYNAQKSSGTNVLKRIRCTNVSGFAEDAVVDMLFIMSKGGYYGLDTNGIELKTLPVLEGVLEVQSASPMIVNILKQRFPQLKIKYNVSLLDPKFNITWESENSFYENERMVVKAVSSNDTYAEVEYLISNYRSYAEDEVSINATTGEITISKPLVNDTYTKYIDVTARSIYNRQITTNDTIIIKGVKIDSIEIQGVTSLVSGEEGELNVVILPENHTKTSTEFILESDKPELVSIVNSNTLRASVSDSFDVVSISAYYNIQNSPVAIQQIAYNDGPIATIETNPELVRAAYQKGWCSSTELLLSDALLVSTSALNGLFYSNKTILHFNEYRYFNHTFVSSYCFSNSAVREITLPKTIQNIANGAFINSAIESITIPSKTTTIGYSAFENSALKEVIFEPSLEFISIKKLAFLNSNITNLDLTTRPFYLNGASFGCNPITEFTLTENIDIGTDNPFCGCPLEKISCEKNNYYIENNAIIQIQSSNNVIRIPTLNTTEIPSSVKIIGGFAFAYFPQHINLPETVTEIQQYAFYYAKIKSINLHKNISSIQYYTYNLNNDNYSHGTRAFAYSDIEEAVVDGNATWYFRYASRELFYYCAKLKNVTFLGDTYPGGTLNSDIWMFTGCTSLKTVVSPDFETELGYDNTGIDGIVTLNENVEIARFNNTSIRGLIITGTKVRWIYAGNNEFIDEYFALEGFDKCVLEHLNLKKLKLQTIDLTNHAFIDGSRLEISNCVVDNLITPKTTNTSLLYSYYMFQNTKINNLTVSSDFIYTSGNTLFYVKQSCTFLEDVTKITAVTSFHQAERQSVVVTMLSKNITEIRSNAFSRMYNVKEIYCHSETAPLIHEDCFSSWGNEPINVYVPQNATGYDEGLWLQLQTDGRFTINYTL